MSVSILSCRLEKASAEAELEATRSRASDAQQSLGEQLSQGVTTVAMELHKLRGLTRRLHVALGADQVSAAVGPTPVVRWLEVLMDRKLSRRAGQ